MPEQPLPDVTIFKATYLMPGFFFPEEHTIEVLPSDPVADALAKAPSNAYCFTIFEVSPAPDLGPEFKVVPTPRNRSKRHYIGGEIFTLAEVQAMPDTHIMATNMECNHWPLAIRCRTGNWQPFEDDDTLHKETDHG